MKMATEINGLLAASVGFLGAIIGAIIGGVMVYFASVKSVTVQTRVSYVLSIVNLYPDVFASFYEALRNADVNRLVVLRNSWFYHLLVMPLPSKIKRQFEDSLDNREWDKAMDLLRKIASGEWD
jgi:hypothetical protein